MFAYNLHTFLGNNFLIWFSSFALDVGLCWKMSYMSQPKCIHYCGYRTFSVFNALLMNSLGLRRHQLTFAVLLSQDKLLIIPLNGRRVHWSGVPRSWVAEVFPNKAFLSVLFLIARIFTQDLESVVGQHRFGKLKSMTRNPCLLVSFTMV